MSEFLNAVRLAADGSLDGVSDAVTRKSNCYQKVIICTSEPRRLIFVYGDAIFALPEAFFFGYSGAIFERSISPFHCLQRRKIYPLSSENCRYQKSLFRVVENSKFLNRLRNGHLEKSVATGICRVQRSPKTAKTPRKVHLRLRFQNLGKPRTAGLCG